MLRSGWHTSPTNQGLRYGGRNLQTDAAEVEGIFLRLISGFTTPRRVTKVEGRSLVSAIFCQK